MKKSIIRTTLLLSILFALFGCSGGGSGSSDGNQVSDENGGAAPPVTGGSGSDISPPRVTLTPMNGSEIGLSAAIQLDFSEPLTLQNVALSGSMAKLGELSQVDGDTFVFQPSERWAELSELTLVVNAEDAAGNKMEALSASYSIDSTAPFLVRITPENIRLEKNDSIQVVFSEAMDIGSLQLTGSLLEDEYKISWSKTHVENDTLTVLADERWVAGQERAISITAKDLAGNATTTLTSRFTVPLYFENFDAAKVVIGQDDFSSSTSGISAKNFAYFPRGDVAVDGDGRLFVGDTSLNRVLVFHSIPTVNGASANMVMGKDDLDTLKLSDSRQLLQRPVEISFDRGRLLIAQSQPRLLSIYDNIPEGGGAIPALNIKPRGGDNIDCWNEAGFDLYWGASIADGKLFATDEINSRVFIWSAVPEDSGTPADLIVGQSTMEHCFSNDRNQDATVFQPSAQTLALPSDVWSDGEKMAIVDGGNNRILLWDKLPGNNFTAADIVLGQASFSDKKVYSSSDEEADGPINEKTLSEPSTGIWSNGVQLFIADGNNNRILIWDRWPEKNFAPADYVLGQSDFYGSIENDANQNGIADPGELPNASTFKSPTGIFAYKDTLFITDSGNRRILLFKSR
ncbi:Ig-like domain-containing protein [Microbulbifer sp. 2304DJ12-6]|uniref:Ig-like domain-containing protein n=1 Tax=Microbulbifer sp. 2304DJ12-6 TaxID=3233340 RepID=UPI0039B0C3A0